MSFLTIKINKFNLCFFMLSLMLILPCSPAWSATPEDTGLVRVGLAQNTTAVSFTLQGDYRVRDMFSGQLITGLTTGNWLITNADGKCRIYRDGKMLGLFIGPVRAESKSTTGNINLISLTSNDQTKQYRGSIEVRTYEDGLTLINELPIEEYLYSVVPSEMPATFPVEALEAQAVAARSYLISHLGRYENLGFDILNNQYNQVYNGFDAEHPISVLAVDKTKDLVLVHDNQIVEAFFHASSGGYTENSEDIWIEQLGYVRTKTDAYDYNDRYYDWTVTYSMAELTALINQQMQKRTQTEYIPLVAITDLSNLEMTASGYRVKKLLVQGVDSTGDAHAYTLANSDQVRSFLGLKSSLFTTSWKETPAGVISSITFKGSGNGHGLGMSQYGAAGMANEGYSFQEILQYYYTDVELLPYDIILELLLDATE